MYAKIFASLFGGSMRGQSDVILVFVNMLATCDADGTVDKTQRVIADETGLPLERVQTALAVLESPDPDSRTPDLEGRRIVRLEEHRSWGWSIVNYAKYRAMRDDESRREQVREAVRKYRKNHPKKQAERVINGNQDVITNDYQVITCNQSNQCKPKQKQKQKNITTEQGGAGGEITNPPAKSFKDWTRDDLVASVNTANRDGLLTDQECREFVDYWTEPSATGRFRIALEKTWDTRRRMHTALNVVYSVRRSRRQASVPANHENPKLPF